MKLLAFIFEQPSYKLLFNKFSYNVLYSVHNETQQTGPGGTLKFLYIRRLGLFFWDSKFSISVFLGVSEK